MLQPSPRNLSELKGGLGPAQIRVAETHLRQIGTSKLRLKGEDAMCSRSPPLGPRLLAVADGHGGSAAALHCCASHTRANVLDIIEVQLQQAREAQGVVAEADFESACSFAFKLAHKAVRALPGVDAGSTLTVAVLDDDRQCLTVANVGDSFALLGARSACTPIALAPPRHTTPPHIAPARSSRGWL